MVLNVCVEEDPLRATILRYSLDGKPVGSLVTLGRHAANPIWANGLRNSQGFAWQPKTGAMFATNEGADDRSKTKNGQVNDDIPPEHLNRIESGKHYGWPYCWGDHFQDPNFVGADNFCRRGCNRSSPRWRASPQRARRARRWPSRPP